jgi:hypothetical protein
MPRCPKCAKRFKDDGRVLQHMNQPFSPCYDLPPPQLVNVSHTFPSGNTRRAFENLDFVQGADSEFMPSYVPPNLYCALYQADAW